MTHCARLRVVAEAHHERRKALSIFITPTEPIAVHISPHTASPLVGEGVFMCLGSGVTLPLES